MARPFRKKVWVWAVSLVGLVVLVAALPPVRINYHKWCLDGVKERKARLLASKPSVLDRFWLNLGYPISGQELDAKMRNHETALVHLGFLDQTSLPMQMVAACPETLDTLDDLKSECPWYHAETLSSTNFVVTACPKMMEHWRQRAKKLGW